MNPRFCQNCYANLENCSNNNQKYCNNMCAFAGSIPHKKNRTFFNTNQHSPSSQHISVDEKIEKLNY